MKRLLLIAMLLIVGAAFAASSAPTQVAIGPTSDPQALNPHCWCGEATGPWETFEIYFDPGTGYMWGSWYKGTTGGWIEGFGGPDPAGESADWYIGEGIFGGDDTGGWQGTFVLNDKCWGKVWNPDVIGDFYGWPCE